MNNDPGRELSWDDAIEKDSEFTLLPAGDYDFEVVGFERGRHPGSDKLTPCNKAVISLRINAPNGDTTIVKHNLFLHTKTEGMLCAFFLAIGQRKHGERLVMNWNKVTGERGRLKLGVREYNGNQFNEVKQFYEPDSAPRMQYETGRF